MKKRPGRPIFVKKKNICKTASSVNYIQYQFKTCFIFLQNDDFWRSLKEDSLLRQDPDCFVLWIDPQTCPPSGLVRKSTTSSTSTRSSTSAAPSRPSSSSSSITESQVWLFPSLFHLARYVHLLHGYLLGGYVQRDSNPTSFPSQLTTLCLQDVTHV